MGRFLDRNGVAHLWDRMKQYVDSKSGGSANYIVIEGTAESIAAKSTKTVTFTEEQLAEYGITDVDKIEVVAFSVKEKTAVWHRQFNAYYEVSSGDQGYNFVYPSAEIVHIADANRLELRVYNVSASTASLDYRVVLTKLA